jgi:hypothetical protein
MRAAPRLAATLFGLTSILGGATMGRAQDDFGTTGAVVLRMPVGARPVALGDAYTAVEGDELSVFYNPGGLASAAALSLGASYQSYISDARLITLSGTIPVGPGTLGLGVNSLDFGSIDEVREDPTFAGQTGKATGRQVGASEFVAVAGYGVRARPGVGGGVAARVVRSDIAGTSGTAVAADLGVRVAPWGVRGPSLGASLLNLGTDVKLAGRSDPLPRTFRVGAALAVGDAAGLLGGLATLDLVAVRGGATRLGAGIEAGRGFGDVRLMGRLGLRTTTADESLADAVTFGGGLEIGPFRLDYAYLGFDLFGATHRFGLRWQQPL